MRQGVSFLGSHTQVSLMLRQELSSGPNSMSSYYSVLTRGGRQSSPKTPQSDMEVPHISEQQEGRLILNVEC